MRSSSLLVIAALRSSLVLDRPHGPELVDGDRLPGVADALLPEQDRAPAVEPDRDRDDRHHRQRERQQQQREEEIDQRLQVEIAARRDQRAEAVLRQMLELDPAGQRFRQLLDLVDDAPGKRRVGEERFPFVGQARR